MEKETKIRRVYFVERIGMAPGAAAAGLMLIVMMGIANGGVESGSDDPFALYVLGDSSVNCGDNNLFYPFLHHNLSLLPCNGSGSTLLPYFLAEKIGLPHILPFYSQNGSVEELLRGVNFGSAQATIINPNSPSDQSLNEQLRQVFETLQLLQLQLPENQASHFIQSSIFYLSFGKDDYIKFLLGNYNSLVHGREEFAGILVNQMVRVMRSLYDANVRKMVCVGIMPLGCTPRMVLDFSSGVSGNLVNGCVREVNEAVLEYNQLLGRHILGLNEELSNVQIVFCDIYQAIMEMVTNPSQYGFEDARNACCGIGLYGAMMGCLSTEMACDQASIHIWWDLYNPTEMVNSLLASSVWFGKPFSKICHPTNIQDIVS